MLFTSSTDVYLSLNGEVIPNHGYVDISNIGSSNTGALLCHTDGSSSGGDWFAPAGTRVGGVGDNKVTGVRRNRDSMLVRLIRNSGTPAEGIYRCDVDDATDTPHRVYVGLYNTEGGMYIYCKFALSLTCHYSLHKLSQVRLQYQLVILPLTSMGTIPSSPSPVSPLVDLLPLSLGPETPLPLSLKELRLC